jgi:LysM repeat protein
LGAPAKHAKKRLPLLAAPTLFGVAAAFVMSAAPAGASTVHTTDVRHPAASDTVNQAALPKLLADFRTTAAQGHNQAVTTASTTKRTYTVKEGDTLSKIAQHYYSESAAWPVIYYANRHSIKSVDDISVGQKLTIPAKPAKIPAAPAVPVAAPVSQVSTSAAPAQVTSTAQPASTYHSQPASTYSGGSGFQSCVISRESGGNSQVMNGSGHYGLYQFSEGTWEAYGGSASSFGNASVAEQNQVFNNAISQGGESNWSAYDGC